LEEAFGRLSNEQKDVLGALQRSNSRQLTLVDNLLSVYRNDNLGVDVQVTDVNMDDLIADILTELQFLANEREITLEYACQQAPPPISGEAIQLKRVLSNLIHNALNYTPARGRIQVHLKSGDGVLRVEVQDTGPGLSPQDLENVFHRFYRAGGSRQVIGTGLGLYLSRQIIEAHQGQIWAENIKPTGCRFVFTLPLRREGVSG
jgi:two-component system NarL family sensor kinase